MGGAAEVDSEAVTQIAAPQLKGWPRRKYVLSWRPRLPAPPCAPQGASVDQRLALAQLEPRSC